MTTLLQCYVRKRIKTAVPDPLLGGVLGRLPFKRGAPARDERTDMLLTGYACHNEQWRELSHVHDAHKNIVCLCSSLPSLVGFHNLRLLRDKHGSEVLHAYVKVPGSSLYILFVCQQLTGLITTITVAMLLVAIHLCACMSHCKLDP